MSTILVIRCRCSLWPIPQTQRKNEHNEDPVANTQEEPTAGKGRHKGESSIRLNAQDVRPQVASVLLGIDDEPMPRDLRQPQAQHAAECPQGDRGSSARKAAPLIGGPDHKDTCHPGKERPPVEYATNTALLALGLRIFAFGRQQRHVHFESPTTLRGISQCQWAQKRGRKSGEGLSGTKTQIFFENGSGVQSYVANGETQNMSYSHLASGVLETVDTVDPSKISVIYKSKLDPSFRSGPAH